MNKITNEMVIHLNEELKKKGCHFHYMPLTFPNSGEMYIKRNINNTSEFIVDATIGCNKAFYEWLDKFFMDNYNIVLAYSKDGNACWIFKKD